MGASPGAPKLYPVPYNKKSILTEEIIVDGERFEWSEKFLLIANRAIPKGKKVYMEIIIDHYELEKDIRFVPIMVGIHKEPSFGVLGSDFCLGTVFYSVDPLLSANEDEERFTAFKVYERYNHQANLGVQFVNEITSPVPNLNSVIGVGVDMTTAKITIFNNGVPMYSFAPMGFYINNQPNNIYFAMYMAQEFTNKISGIFNLGQFKTKYKPEGYNDLYEEYYRKIKTNKSFDISFEIMPINAIYYNDPEIPGNVNLNNDIAPLDADGHRDPYLILNHSNMTFYKYEDDPDSIDKHMFYFHNNLFTKTVHDMAYIRFPIPADQKVFVELKCKEAQFSDESVYQTFDKIFYEGIPLSIGLIKDPNNYKKKAIFIDLYHVQYGAFKVKKYINNNETIFTNYSILNPQIPKQPNVISVLLDRPNNRILIYTEGVEFIEINTKTDLGIDLTSIYEQYYFYIDTAPETLMDNDRGVVSVYTGNDDLKYGELIDNEEIMSLWYYYNYTIKNTFPGDDLDFDIRFKVIPAEIYFSKYIDILFDVNTYSTTELKHGNGLNRLFDTYNVVSDHTDYNNEPNISIFELEKLMDNDINER